MDRSHRQGAYVVAIVAFGAAAMLPVLGWVSSGGRFVQSATLTGLARLALGLYLSTPEEPE